MSMSEPLVPHPQREETIAAADPGAGAPPTAEGFGVEGEEPDVDGDGPAGGDADRSLGEAAADAAGTPFRTPDPDDVRRA